MCKKDLLLFPADGNVVVLASTAFVDGHVAQVLHSCNVTADVLEVHGMQNDICIDHSKNLSDVHKSVVSVYETGRTCNRNDNVGKVCSRSESHKKIQCCGKW